MIIDFLFFIHVTVDARTAAQLFKVRHTTYISVNDYKAELGNKSMLLKLGDMIHTGSLIIIIKHKPVVNLVIM